jgi:adenylate kinase
MKYPAFLIFGPPGSGKGTQGKALCQFGDFVHVSSGEIFRNLDPHSEYGKLFLSYANKGELAPNDELVVEMVKEHVQRLVKERKFDPSRQKLLLDGIPRTKEQSKLLDQAFSIEQIILIQVSDNKELIKRMQHRSLVEGRKDDENLDILNKRFEIYKEQSKEALSFYSKNKLLKINGLQKPLQVLHDILDAILFH